MKILLSAYACQPNRGSEPGVGWHWAVELLKLGYHVWVITRKNNQSDIETELLENTYGDLHFIYYDLPNWAKWWKKGRRGIHLYYLLWQWGAYLVVKKLHAKEKFDRVHHITLVSVRQPSFMGRLNIPFIFGPIAGGEVIPRTLRRSFTLRSRLADAIRDLANLLPRIDPLLLHTFSKAEKIYATSSQTRNLIPKRFRQKTQVKLAIGWSGEQIQIKKNATEQNIKILYAGHFLFLKGMHLGLRAFQKLLEQHPHSILTMVGQGPDEKNLRLIAEELGIAKNMNWVGWVSQSELSKIYSEHDIFLFPSLRDSGGMVALEAMAHGLPVVCLDLGGVGVMLNDACGRVIATRGRSELDIVGALGNALIELGNNRELLAELSVGAARRAKNYEWSNVVREIYSEIVP